MSEGWSNASEFADTPIEPFSAGYYGARMEVQAYDDGPVIEQTLYDYIDSSIYQQTDAPPWARVGMTESPYFELDAEPGVPGNVLGLPERFIEEHTVLDNGHIHWVLLVEPGFAYMLSASERLEEKISEVPFEQ